MELKQKINLLTDLNSALEDETLKAAVSRISSGELIYEIFTKSINEYIKEIFNTVPREKDEQVEKSVSSILEMLNKLDNHVIITSLKMIEQRLQAVTLNEPPPVPPMTQPPVHVPTTSIPAGQIQFPQNPHSRGSVMGLGF